MSFLNSLLFQKHGKAAGIGLIAVVLFSMASVTSPALHGSVDSTTVDIGIEHQKPLALGFEYGVNNDTAIAEFTSQSDETVFLSVPSTWARREVKNAPIDQVSSEPPSLGFTRWTLPSHAGVSFSIPDAPDSVILHNPTGVQMKLDFAYADLQTEEAQKDVLLIQEDTVKLW